MALGGLTPETEVSVTRLYFWRLLKLGGLPINSGLMPTNPSKMRLQKQQKSRILHSSFSPCFNHFKVELLRRKSVAP
jgi:hypothetical protein